MKVGSIDGIEKDIKFEIQIENIKEEIKILKFEIRRKIDFSWTQIGVRSPKIIKFYEKSEINLRYIIL